MSYYNAWRCDIYWSIIIELIPFPVLYLNDTHLNTKFVTYTIYIHQRITKEIFYYLKGLSVGWENFGENSSTFIVLQRKRSREAVDFLWIEMRSMRVPSQIVLSVNINIKYIY